MDENAIIQLALDAIKWGLQFDMMHHNQHGCGDYTMEDGLKALVRRARAIGLKVTTPYEGYQYLDQADAHGQDAATPSAK